MTEKTRKAHNNYLIWLIIAIGVVYLFSNLKPQDYYDYTFRVAENILRGSIGFEEKPPSWLNEFVPFEDRWYSVFPLGSVLTMIPFAFFKVIGLLKVMPAAFLSALTSGIIGAFLLRIAGHYDLDRKRRILMTVGILFGTWMWTNLAMGGAWQLALGFAMIGELGAIYFTVFERRPLLAGAFFALAFGNRTEILLTAPVFFYLLYHFQILNFNSQIFNSENGENKPSSASEKDNPETLKTNKSNKKAKLEDHKTPNGNFKFAPIINFCIVPFILGVLTLIYNDLRFHSLTDFGYARIPGVLEEPWYRYGIFSIWYIPQNFREMLWTPWRLLAHFPYLVPGGFGSAVWWSSPFILFLARFGARDKILKYTGWTAILILTFLLWIHGNAGGWQFGYRYAMILLPWMFLILLENSPKKVFWYEWTAYLFSVVVNAYATYLFLWTNYVKP